MFRQEREWTPLDRKLSEQMSAMLIAFANTGDPSIKDVKWPAWSPANEVKIEITDRIATVPLDVKGIEWLKAHPVPSPLGTLRIDCLALRLQAIAQKTLLRTPSQGKTICHKLIG